MTNRTYVEIPAEEIVAFLIVHGFEERLSFHGERIFAKQYGRDEEMIVYSSLSSHAGAVRPVGMDAIRLVVRWSKDKWFHKAGKVLRIATWQKNFRAKMEAAEQKFGLDVQEAERIQFRREHPEDVQDAVVSSYVTLGRCVYCGEEPNGMLADGRPACSWHTQVELSAVAWGEGKDHTAVVKMDRAGNIIAVAHLAEA